MIYYDRRQKFEPLDTFLHLHEYMEDEISPHIIRMYNWFDVIYYTAVGITSAIILGFNFVSFFITMAVVLCAEYCGCYLVFYIFPYLRTRNTDERYLQRRLEKLEYYESKWSKYDIKERWGYSYAANVKCYYSEAIRIEEKYIEELEAEKVANKATKETDGVWGEKELANINSLKECSATLKKYIEDNNLDFLIDVRKAIAGLLEVIHLKPPVIRLIPNSIFVYLGELLHILNKYKGLSEENASKYIGTISIISSRLTSCINETCESIEKMDVDDIEVSMNVLMNELSSYEDGDIAEEIKEKASVTEAMDASDIAAK